jgi:hypothetical protein
MPLKSDKFGFLVGDSVDWAKAVALWTEIRDGVRALRRSTVGATAEAKRAVNNNGGRSAATASPSTAIRSSAAAIQAVAMPRESLRRAESVQLAKVAAKTAVAVRDNRGRFSSVGSGGNDGGAGNDRFGIGSGTGSRIGNAASGVGRVIKATPDISPVIAASRELGAVVSPLGRGLGKLFGKGDDEKKKTAWYKRMWGELRGLRQDESAFNKAQIRRLTAIEKKPVRAGAAADGGGLGGMMSGLLGRIPGIGPLLSGGLGGMGKMLGGLGKGLLKKLPLIGALFSGGSALASIFGSDDPSKSAADNRKDRFTGAGSGIGAILGGIVGSLGGPVGIVIGGIIGDKVGEMVGEWLSTFDWGKIGDQIVGAWNTAVSYVKGTWDGGVSYIKESWNTAIGKLSDIAKSVGAGWDAVVSGAKAFLKDKFGIDVDAIAGKVKETASAAVATVRTAAAPVVAAVKTGATAVADGTSAAAGYVADRATKMAAPIGRAVVGAKDWVLGKTSQLFESGKGGAGTVSTGKGDFGGASYGTYQLSSKQGTLDNFLKSSKYGKEFDGLTPGSKEFNAKWKDIAKSDPEFGAAQHDFIKSTHYDPAVEGLKRAGIDLSNMGPAVQDALWSTSVQFGAGSAKKGDGAIGLFQRALKGKDTSKMSQGDIVSAVQDYKIANNDSLFKKSSDAVRAGTLSRASAEKEKLLAMAGADAAMPAVSAATTPGIAAMPTVSAVPVARVATVVAPVPAVPESPTATGPTQIAITRKAGRTDARPTSEVGQDLQDRKIAHIATGGLTIGSFP